MLPTNSPGVDLRRRLLLRQRTSGQCAITSPVAQLSRDDREARSLMPGFGQTQVPSALPRRGLRGQYEVTTRSDKAVVKSTIPDLLSFPDYIRQYCNFGETPLRSSVLTLWLRKCQQSRAAPSATHRYNATRHSSSGEPALQPLTPPPAEERRRYDRS
jgi:hypothetical protein